MQHIRAISLDLDDTLWEIGPVIRRAEAKLWQWLCVEYPVIGERWDAERLVTLREQLHGQNPELAHDFRYLRKLTLSNIAIDCGYDDGLVEPAFDVFDEARNQVELFPGVAEELAWLARNFQLLALTNGNANLQSIGIAQHFDHIITAVDVGAAKPALPIFVEASVRTNLKANEILHVGDHPETDVQGALDAGMKCVWLNRNDAKWPAEFQPAHATVQHISELRELLQPALGQQGS